MASEAEHSAGLNVQDAMSGDWRVDACGLKYVEKERAHEHV